jgi:hypothetical protein
MSKSCSLIIPQALITALPVAQVWRLATVCQS